VEFAYILMARAIRRQHFLTTIAKALKCRQIIVSDKRHSLFLALEKGR